MPSNKPFIGPPSAFKAYYSVGVGLTVKGKDDEEEVPYWRKYVGSDEDAHIQEVIGELWRKAIEDQDRKEVKAEIEAIIEGEDEDA